MGRKGVKRKGRGCGKGGGHRMRWGVGVGQGGRVLVWVGVCYAEHIQQNRNARKRRKFYVCGIYTRSTRRCG